MADWNEVVAEVIRNPCAHCPEWVSSPNSMDHVGMPVSRPAYVDDYLEGIAGPNEQHHADPAADCVNPKCGYHFTPQDMASIEANDGVFQCPNCHTTYDYLGSQKNPTFTGTEWSAKRPANPGGTTRSGLSLDQMGQIGEQVVLRMGELPGIGAITSASDTYKFPLDAVIQAQRGNFGCEIKTNHSQAQERFKIGGKQERQEKIAYCLQHGLKPALIGVRLNFFTDKAYIFFREGLTDTWIGNQQMMHVATLDFGDLNPFKSPDQQAQALAVENAHLPDQASENPDADLDELFGWGKASANADNAFTFKQDVHRLKVVDPKGKHTHDITRCKTCGHTLMRPSDHKGRFECPTCGIDADRTLMVAARVVVAAPNVDQIAAELGFDFGGRTQQGERKYVYVDPAGVNHSVVVGSGAHGKRAAEIDAQRGRQRMNQCLAGKCSHTQLQGQTPIVPEVDTPGAPVVRAGQTVQINDRSYFIMEIDGSLALVLDTQLGTEDVIPTAELSAPKTSADIINQVDGVHYDYHVKEVNSGVQSNYWKWINVGWAIYIWQVDLSGQPDYDWLLAQVGADGTPENCSRGTYSQEQGVQYVTREDGWIGDNIRHWARQINPAHSIPSRDMRASWNSKSPA